MEMPTVRNATELRPAQGWSRRAQDRATIVIFLAPAVILFITFLVYPILRSIYFSMFDWNGLGPAVDFVGLANFKDILGDAVFRKAVANCFLIVALSLSIQIPVALALAIMVGRDLPGRAFFRMIFFVPYVLSEVITGIIWMSLFNADPERGLINALLVLIPGVGPQNFLSDTRQVVFCIFIVLTWKYFGLHMLLFLAGLQNIPREVEEAASMDGANRWQLTRHITVPMLGTTISTVVLLSVLGSLTQFNLVWVMTGGGPVNASEFMATYMYRFGFKRFLLGYGSAVALVMLAICLIFSVAYMRLARHEEY
jgi:raffinose/stachyose/melibiose transport system permease protein